MRNSEVRKWRAACRAAARLVGERLSPSPFQKRTLEVKIIRQERKTIKRTRPYSYSFRVNERERQLIDEKVNLSGLSRTDFLIRALSEKPVIVVPRGNEMLAELKRHGNNLNQAVKNCYFGEYDRTELLTAVKDCKRAYRSLFSAIGER